MGELLFLGHRHFRSLVLAAVAAMAGLIGLVLLSAAYRSTVDRPPPEQCETDHAC